VTAGALSVYANRADSTAARPLALVYRGPASSPGIPADTATFLRTCSQQFRVEFCGPHPEDLPVNAETLAQASLYVQPGGGDDLTTAWHAVRLYTRPLQQFIRRGGHYLGICMGGYLAATDPGFNLLPGNCNDYTTTRGAEVHNASNSVITVDWPSPGHPTLRKIFYQDGPYFWLTHGAHARMLARYTNGRIAAMVAPYGNGSVGVSGPHPEANRTWYSGLPYPGGTYDLGHTLVDAIMTPTASQ
jgi:glutamine amidotransferase-like uncharacterized protein